LPYLQPGKPPEQVWLAVFRYLEMLFQLVKPKRVFYIAIDGVAPRAKMNNQRERRYRAANNV
jgi:5'-3' exoribonuclease 1